MTTTHTTTTRGRRLSRLALTAGGAALALGAGLTAVPANAADTGNATLEAIKSCESGGDCTAVNASSGASGAYQFLDATWQSVATASTASATTTDTAVTATETAAATATTTTDSTAAASTADQAASTGGRGDRGLGPGRAPG